MACLSQGDAMRRSRWAIGTGIGLILALGATAAQGAEAATLFPAPKASWNQSWSPKAMTGTGLVESSPAAVVPAGAVRGRPGPGVFAVHGV
jgi:hypothetical protein